jgi:hypothetical protein
MNGRAPNEVYNELYPVAARRLPEPGALVQLFWESSDPRKVENNAVRMDNRRYIPADAASSAALFLANQTEVCLWYDPNEPTEAVVARLGEKTPFARVRAEVLTPHSPAAQPIISESMRERRRLRNAASETISAIKTSAARLGHQSDYEVLRERALLPEAVGGLVTQRVQKETKPAQGEAPKYVHDVVETFFQEG